MEGAARGYLDVHFDGAHSQESGSQGCIQKVLPLPVMMHVLFSVQVMSFENKISSKLNELRMRERVGG